jgi:hypothetical protein
MCKFDSNTEGMGAAAWAVASVVALLSLLVIAGCAALAHG